LREIAVHDLSGREFFPLAVRAECPVGDSLYIELLIPDKDGFSLDPRARSSQSANSGERCGGEAVQYRSDGYTGPIAVLTVISYGVGMDVWLVAARRDAPSIDRPVCSAVLFHKFGENALAFE
jgi:hypothetical protein